MFFIFLIFSLSWGADSRSLTGTGSSMATLPNTATFTQADWRVETLITGLDTASNGSNREIFNIGGLRVYIPANQQYFLAEISSPSIQTSVPFPKSPTNDVIDATGNWILVFEFTRLPNSTTDRVLKLGVYNPSNSRLLTYDESTVVSSASATFSIAGGGVTLGSVCAFAWMRVFSTKFDRVTMQPTGHLPAGDLLDWEFGSDSRVDSANSVTLTGGSFSDTPAAVMLTMPRDQTVRAGWPGTISASTIGATSYLWSITSYPSNGAGTISQKTSGTPVLKSSSPGEYTLSVRAIVAGVTYTGTMKVGAVRQNSSGTIDAGTEAKNTILGPMLRLESSRYTRFPFIRRLLYTYGERFAAMETRDLGTWLSGTITVTNGSTAITGSGTSLSTSFTCDGSGEVILIHYPVGDGTYGYAPYGVANSACTATSLTLSANWTFPTNSGVQFLRWTATDNLRYTEGINYYDVPLGFYQNFYTTGLSEYKTYAQTAARTWWLASANGGRTIMDPATNHIPSRRYPFAGLVLWALDLADLGSTNVTIDGQTLTGSQWSTKILKWLNHAAGITGWINLDNQTPTAKPSDFGKQPREAAYATLHHILMALVAPTSSGTVSVSGTTVSWASGDEFEHYLWYTKTITINGSPYTINTSTSRTSLGVSSAPGNGTFNYSVDNAAIHLAKVNEMITNYWLPWQCKASNPSPRCQTNDGAYRGLDPGSVYAGTASMPFMESLIPEMLSRAYRLTGFTSTTDLDTVLSNLGTWLMNGTGNGGTTLWITSSGYSSRTCKHPQYWLLATAGGASDSNGNQPDGAACATEDRLESNRTLSNDYWGAIMQRYAVTNDTTYRDRADEAANAICRDDNVTECDGFSGIGMELPVGSEDWTLAQMTSPSKLKQVGQGTRSTLAANAWRVNDPYSAGGTTTVKIGFRLPTAADRITWETTEGRTGTCITSPCSITTEARLGTTYRFTAKNGSTTIRVGLWHELRVQ